MAQVIWTEPALADLDQIVEYIALDKISAAKSLARKDFSSLDHLEQFPNSGRRPPELKKSKYSEIIVGPCRIFYRVDKNIVYIIYIMRSEKLLRRYILESRDEDS